MMPSARSINRCPGIRIPLLSLLVLLAACAGNRATRTEPPPSPPADLPDTQLITYECEAGFQFKAHFSGEHAWLFLPDETIALAYIPSEPGVTYGNAGSTLRTDGTDASLETPDATYPACHSYTTKAVWIADRVQGVDFKAAGNEPGWTVTIDLEGSIVLVTDYGASRFIFETPAPEIEQEITRYRVRNEQEMLTVEILDQPCEDTMSGEPFEATVTVYWQDRTYHGCGSNLH